MCTGILFVNQIKCDSGIFYLLTKTRIFVTFLRLMQVEQIRGRLRVNKATEHVSTVDSMFSPVTTCKGQLIQINQSHLLAALKKTHPSVSEKERRKFKRM